MTSLRDIATQSNVSPATVSRALNRHPQVSKQTRDKVIRVARSLGYPIQSRTPSHSTDLQRIGLVYPGPVWIGMHSPFDAAVMRGLAGCMAEHDFELTLVDLRQRLRPEESYASLLESRGLSAMVLRSDDSTLHLCERLAETGGIPSILLGERPAGADLSYVTSGSKAASREAVEHLIALGHRRIAICVNNVITTDHRDRIQGWQEALEAHGIEPSPSDRIQLPATHGNGGVLLRKLMSSSPRPTAVFVVDPYPAVGLICEARNLGVRIPDDLSVIGFDDDDMRAMTAPSMSAVCQDSAALGRTAVTLLRRMIDGALEEPAHMCMDAWFDVRETTAPPNEEWSGKTPELSGRRRFSPRNLSEREIENV